MVSLSHIVQLIADMTDERRPLDHGLRSAFLMTYRIYFSPKDLSEALVKRLHMLVELEIRSSNDRV